MQRNGREVPIQSDRTSGLVKLSSNSTNFDTGAATNFNFTLWVKYGGLIETISFECSRWQYLTKPVRSRSMEDVCSEGLKLVIA